MSHADRSRKQQLQSPTFLPKAGARKTSVIVLASTSITRKALLNNAGILVTSVTPDVDERKLIAENPMWGPAETSLNLARAKAVDVSGRSMKTLVVGADQVLSIRNQIYSKPADMVAARYQLNELRGQTHELISSAACVRNGVELWNTTDRARLKMRHFSDEFLENYLQNNGRNCMTSVGGYQIEGLGSQLFESIDGDYFTILGLPLFPLMQFLRSTGELPA